MDIDMHALQGLAKERDIKLDVFRYLGFDLFHPFVEII